MNIKHICERIAGYYNGQNDYTKNSTFSDRYTTVYTSDRGKGWLIIEKRGDTAIEARLTDNEGVIIARDVYNINGEVVTVKSAERQVRDSTAMVTFMPEELSILQSFGEDYSKDTTDHLRIIAPLIQDEQARNTAFRTADKIDMLSETSYSELNQTTNRRYELDVEHYIQLWTAKKKMPKADRNMGKSSKVKDKGDRSL